ncbi:Transmembrane protein 41A [Mortierella claussenii]|nr:Transmembrane protein 41A [Mortierella claussenii]
MATFVASASAAGAGLGAASSAATVAALGRFHTSTRSDNSIYSLGRQRSSSVTSRQPSSSVNGPLAHSTSSAAVTAHAHLLASKKLTMSTDAAGASVLNKGLFQQDLSAPLAKSMSYSGLSIVESSCPTNTIPSATTGSTTSRAHQYQREGFERTNLVPSSTSYSDININNHSNNNSNNNSNSAPPNWLPPPPASPIDHNTDMQGDQAPGNTRPVICTGRSRSSTLTTTSTGAVDVAVASISTQFNHVVRPRRSSLVNRPTGGVLIRPTPAALPAFVSPAGAAVPSHTTVSHSHHYPPDSILPQYHEVEESQTSFSTSNTNRQRGLYLLAQVLPPLSLPKSIDDVKVDAAILQEFATATYEGWTRTFWVFSTVYIWKQCFGIPGSAFLNILAGALYGPWVGTVLTSLLTTFGSVLAYFMSFFLMEPILNRYASSRLDQMRLLVQKKTMRSASSKKWSTSLSTATSTAVQTSINASPSASSGTGTAVLQNGSSASPSAQRTSLRTRSSSFTVRKTDGGPAEQDMGSPSSSVYCYASHFAFGATLPQLDDTDTIQEHEGLLKAEHKDRDSPSPSSLALSMDQQNGMAIMKEHQPERKEEDEAVEENDEDGGEGTSLFMQLLLIRLFPLTPYWFINLASPLVGVPVVPFMTSMFLGVMPYNYICAQAGAILSEIHELRDIYQQPWILFQVVMVLVLCTAAVLLSKRTKKKQMEKDSQRKNKKSRSSEDERQDDESTHRLLRSSFADMDQQQGQDRGQTERDSIAMSSLGPEHHASSSSNNKCDSAIIDIDN